MSEYLFTSESVTEGHPDKACDAFSDAILDNILSKDKDAHVACESLATKGLIVISGEVRTRSSFEVKKIVREAIRKIGYNSKNSGVDPNDVEIITKLHEQSSEIAQGVDSDNIAEQGAGDQGLMFGYACLETENYMPMAIYLCHKILERVQDERKNHVWILPDNKSQVTLTYNDINKPKNIEKIVCSTQHAEDVDIEYVRKKIEEIIRDEIKEDLSSTEFLINPTGRFVIGGPDGDTGLTGRKIIVDTYGGYAPHGGGAFSGKDCTKVDRSGAYMARYLAKNIVSSGRASNATVQLSYAIGVVEPTSVYVYADGKVRPDLANWIKENVDLSPKGIIDKFSLFELDLTETTLYGHFGRDNLPYERLDLF